MLVPEGLAFSLNTNFWIFFFLLLKDHLKFSEPYFLLSMIIFIVKLTSVDHVYICSWMVFLIFPTSGQGLIKASLWL